MSGSSQFFVNDGFNHNFTDEDARMLISFATSPEYRLHTCQWVGYGGRCNTDIEGKLFPTHLREHHGIAGQERAVFRCNWDGCTDATLVNRDGLVRHIQGKHLHWKYLCPDCGMQFSREATRNAHHAQCEGADN